MGIENFEEEKRRFLSDNARKINLFLYSPYASLRDNCDMNEVFFLLHRANCLNVFFNSHKGCSEVAQLLSVEEKKVDGTALGSEMLLWGVFNNHADFVRHVLENHSKSIFPLIFGIAFDFAVVFDKTEVLDSLFPYLGSDAVKTITPSLLYAAQLGYINKVERLITLFEFSNEVKNEAFVRAFKASHIAVIKLLSNHTVLSDDYKRRVLNLAVKTGDLGFLKKLPNQFSLTNDLGFLFYKASEDGHFHIVEWMLENMNIVAQDMYHAFYVASSNGHERIVQYLLSKHEFNVQEMGESLLIATCKKRCNIVEILLPYVPSADPSRYKSYFKAVKSNNFELLNLFIDRSDTLLEHKNKIFEFAGLKGKLAIVRLLLDKCESISDAAKGEVLMAASYEGWMEIVLLLLEDDDKHKVYEENAFIYAVKSQKVDIVKLLLGRNRISEMAKNNSLKDALKINQMEIVELFLESDYISIEHKKEALYFVLQNGSLLLLLVLLRAKSIEAILQDDKTKNELDAFLNEESTLTFIPSAFLSKEAIVKVLRDVLLPEYVTGSQPTMVGHKFKNLLLDALSRLADSDDLSIEKKMNILFSIAGMSADSKMPCPLQKMLGFEFANLFFIKNEKALSFNIAYRFQDVDFITGGWAASQFPGLYFSEPHAYFHIKERLTKLAERKIKANQTTEECYTALQKSICEYQKQLNHTFEEKSIGSKARHVLNRQKEETPSKKKRKIS